MDDLISRQAAIDAAIEAVDEWDGGYNLRRADMIADAINNSVPSAQPKRIKGRWTKAYDGYDGHVKCVQCFKTYDWDTQAQYYNFCPMCGAWMLEEPYKEGQE